MQSLGAIARGQLVFLPGRLSAGNGNGVVLQGNDAGNQYAQQARYARVNDRSPSRQFIIAVIP